MNNIEIIWAHFSILEWILYIGFWLFFFFMLYAWINILDQMHR